MEIHTDSQAEDNNKYLDELESATLESWLIAVNASTKRPRELTEMENSISWKITKPLRYFRQFASKVKRNLNFQGFRKMVLKSFRDNN